jgi:hypothetical protein
MVGGNAPAAPAPPQSALGAGMPSNAGPPPVAHQPSAPGAGTLPSGNAPAPLYSRLAAGAPPADTWHSGPASQQAADLTIPAGGRRPRTGGEEDDFDDFAALRNETRQPEFPDFDDDDDEDEDDDIPNRLGWGASEPTAPAQDAKRHTKYYMFAGAGAVAILVVVAVIMLLQADPPELTTTPLPPPAAAGGASAAPPAVQIDLKEPDIRGNQVVLTWTSNPEKLDFAVVVTRADEPGKAVVVPHREHTLTVPIDDVSAYCFQVQASNSDPTEPLHESQARPIRGSDC